MRESVLQTKVLKLLKGEGWFYKASDRFRAGVPDVIGCYKGRFVAIELKVEPNKPTPLQKHEIERIYREDGAVFVVSYNNKTKIHKANNTEYKTLGELITCILRQSLSTTKRNALKL